MPPMVVRHVGSGSCPTLHAHICHSIKHKRVVEVTTRFASDKDGLNPIPIQPFSFPSSLRQLHGLRKSRSWNRRCGEGAWNRSSNMQSGYAAPEHHVRGACRGGSLNVCALDVGAFDFLLNNFCTVGQLPIPTYFPIKRADYSGWSRVRQVLHVFGCNPAGTLVFSKSEISQRKFRQSGNDPNKIQNIGEIRPFAAFAFQGLGFVKR